MSRLVSAAIASALPLTGVPDEIVYIPEGISEITPYVDGKPQSIKVRVDASNGVGAAKALQAALERRLPSNVRPWTDFEHKKGASSGNPKSFRYEPGKGIILAMDWSRGGKEAIEGKDFIYCRASPFVKRLLNVAGASRSSPWVRASRPDQPFSDSVSQNITRASIDHTGVRPVVTETIRFLLLNQSSKRWLA